MGTWIRQGHEAEIHQPVPCAGQPRFLTVCTDLLLLAGEASWCRYISTAADTGVSGSTVFTATTTVALTAEPAGLLAIPAIDDELVLALAPVLLLLTGVPRDFLVITLPIEGHGTRGQPAATAGRCKGRSAP